MKKTAIAAITALLVIPSFTFAAASNASLEKRVAALEDRVAALESSTATSSPVVSPVPVTVVPSTSDVSAQLKKAQTALAQNNKDYDAVFLTYKNRNCSERLQNKYGSPECTGYLTQMKNIQNEGGLIQQKINALKIQSY
ncbi:MAG: hypothetical protein V4480_01050 [Patescibacteria group bacterium]